jgi:ferredoxin-NADP reductase
MRLTAAAVTALTADMREFVLVAADGSALPSYPPGSHVVALGQTLSVSPPRSDFAPVLSARHHVFVAGGIGITPVLAHVGAAVAGGYSFEVHYAARPGQLVHRTELQALCGGRLSSYPGRAALWVNLGPALRDRPLGTHLYTCGPATMIDEVADRAVAAGWPEQRVHAERFATADPDPGTPFAAELGRSGMLVPVAPGGNAAGCVAGQGNQRGQPVPATSMRRMPAAAAQRRHRPPRPLPVRRPTRSGRFAHGVCLARRR